MKVWKPATSYSLGREAGWDPLVAEVKACATPEAVWAWWSDFLVRRHRDYPEVWSLALRDLCEAQEGDLIAEAQHAEMDSAFRATMGAPT